jgi:hypothetical protein
MARRNQGLPLRVGRARFPPPVALHPLARWNGSSVAKSPTEFGVNLSRVVKVKSPKGQAVVE